MSREFSRKRSMRCGGYQWYCQSPGSWWALDPSLGWYLFFTDGHRWWLMGHGREISMHHGLKDSMRAAAKFIDEANGSGDSTPNKGDRPSADDPNDYL
jgi:hypothetical protein